MALVFEPTPTFPKAWTVRNGPTGQVLGGVEWLERLGVYGFGALPGAPVFSDLTMLNEVGRFLDEVNVV